MRSRPEAGEKQSQSSRLQEGAHHVVGIEGCSRLREDVGDARVRNIIIPGINFAPFYRKAVVRATEHAAITVPLESLQ